MATAQPISFQAQAPENTPSGSSFHAQNGSYGAGITPASSSFRRFIGSPLSWRAGSYGNRFFPGVSPGHLLGPLDPNEFKFGKMSSSIESDRGSIVNALSVFERQEELCRDYSCCGLNLTDLHALVDHFEECHVVVLDPYAASSSATGALQGAPGGPSYYAAPQAHQPMQTYHQGSFDPDDMELDMEHPSAPSSSSSTPPDTPVSTPLSAYPSAGLYHHSQPVSAFETTTVLPSRAVVGFPPASRPAVLGVDDAFNAYAGYADYSALLPGTVPSPPIQQGLGAQTQQQQDRTACVPPALLLASSSANTPESTPGSSRVASPAPGASVFRTVAAAPASTSLSTASASASLSSPTGSASTSASAASTARASTTLSRPASSLLLSKPFKCPKPNCNKSYKQANGLKYHMTHGSCNFAPPKDLEQLQVLLAQKRGGKDSDEPISDAEMREVEREAERRLRPYACGVGDCQRRYKNMNGLRYHYQHSGDHGAIGLALLASGQHECLQHSKSHARAHSAAASRTSSPLATPALSRAQSTTAATSASTYAHGHAHAQPSGGASAVYGAPQQGTGYSQGGYAPAGGYPAGYGQQPPPSYQNVTMAPPAYAHAQQSPMQAHQSPAQQHAQSPMQVHPQAQQQQQQQQQQAPEHQQYAAVPAYMMQMS